MATHGAEFTKKLRAAIKAKIEELGVEVDEELPDYIMVMVANKKEKNRMKNDLLLFLGKNSGVFVDWLFGFFEKLQNVGGGTSAATATTESGPRAKDEPVSSKSSSRKEEKTRKEEKEKRKSPPKMEKERKQKSRHESPPAKSYKKEKEPDRKTSKSRRSKSKSPTPESRKSKNYRHEKTKDPERHISRAEKRLSEEPEESHPNKRRRSTPTRPDYSPKTGDERISDGERERQELRRTLTEKSEKSSSKFKVDGSAPTERVVVEDKPSATAQRGEESEDTYGDSDLEDDNIFNESQLPRRKTLRSKVVVHSKPHHEVPPKLQSEVVVKGEELKRRMPGRGQSLFLRAMSDAAGFPGRSMATRRYESESNSDESEEGCLKVPEITPSTRRTVTNRSVEEQPPTFDEIFGDEPNQPRFIITVNKGTDGKRTVQERDRSDSFSEELHEKLTNLQKQQSSPPSTIVEEPLVEGEEKDELFVGVENLPEKDKKADRKRPKRADDPYVKQFEEISTNVLGVSPAEQKEKLGKLRAFMKLAGVSPKKSRPSNEHQEVNVDAQQIKTQQVTVRVKSTNASTKTITRDESPKALQKPLWNGQSLQIRVADLSSSDDEAEIDAVLKTAEELRSNSSKEIPPTSVLSKPITYAHAAYMPPGNGRRVSQTVMQPAPQTQQVTHGIGQHSTKMTERCRFWPNCRLPDEQCVYVHPNKPCANFPNCWYGQKCLYVHPKCKFDANCTKVNCPFVHSGALLIGTSTMAPTSATTTTQSDALKTTVTIQNDSAKGPTADILLVPAPDAGSQPAPTSSLPTFSTLMCKFKGRCRNPNCGFKHPPRCRFGPNCLNPVCSFWHPVDTNKYKWVAPGASQLTMN